MDGLLERTSADLTSAELCRASGATFRQLDYWTRLGLLHSTRPTRGSGFPREFPAVEVCVARLLRVLVGITVISEAQRAALLHEVRSGRRGVVEPIPGLFLDLDTLCA